MAIVLETISDSKAAQADLLRLRGSVENIQKSVEKTTEKFAEFAKTAALIGTAAIAVSNFLKLSDGLTNLNTKIKLATESQEEFEFALKQIRKTALETRTEISSVADLYNKISKAGRDVGASQTTVAKFANTVARAISMSGAGAAQANAAILQLGQGLASGKLAGDELRSVLENAPPLAFALAKGLNVSVGQLRALGEAGALTTEKIFKALLSQRETLEKEFAKVAVTYSAAFTNIKNSLSILAAEISKTFFKSSGSIAIFINDVALKIGKFAENFEYNFVRIKMFLRGFVLDTAILLNSFKNSLNIDLDNFFPKLQEVLPKIKEFVRSVESAFAWLYDRVIGNSWVPDLVLETIDWFKKLLKEPVEIAKEFTSRIDKTFGKMSGIAAGLFLLAKYRTSLLGITGLITSLGFGLSLLMDKKPEAFEGITQSLSKFIDKFKKDFTLPEKIKETSKNIKLLRTEKSKELPSTPVTGASELSPEFRSTEFLAANAPVESSSKFTEKLSNFVKKIRQDFTLPEKIKEAARNIKLLNKEQATEKLSNFVKKIRQDFVLPEKIKEAARNTKIVDKEQAKAIEERPLLKKVFDVIPEGARVPLIAALTVIFTSALVGAFNNEVARKVAFFFGTSVGSLFALRAIDTQVISKTLSDLAYGFVKIIGAGLNAIFDGNILGEKFLGLPILIATLAKIALLFSAGREFIASAIRAGVAAPTNLAQAVIQRGQEKFLRSQAEKVETKLRQQGLNENILKQSQRDLQQNVRTLGNMLAADRIQQAQTSGRPLNAQEIVRARAEAQQQAAKSVAMGQLQGIGPGTTPQINAQFRTIQDQQKIVEEQRKAFNALNNTRLELERQANVIRDARIAATDALKQGAIGAGASLGGALGGIGGLQLGISIAKGMEGASSWQKIGVIISSAILAQVIGTTIGTALVTTIVSGIPFIAGLIASRLSSIFATLIPSIVLRSFLTTFVVGAALFAGVFYTAYKIWELLPDVWKQKLKDSAESVIPGLKKDEKLAEVLTKVGVGPGQPGTGFGIPTLQAIQSLLIISSQQTEKLLKSSEVQPKREDFTELTGSLKDLKASTDRLNENLKPATRPGWQIQKPEDRFGRASGGWIRGPGTATSDSIPALLSNGEFVVNARDAAKNWDILTAINSGMGVKRFAGGSALSPEFGSTEFLGTSLPERTRLEIAKDQAQKVIEVTKDQSAKLKEEAAKQAQKVIESAKNLNEASAKIANSAESLKKGAEDLSNTAARQAAEQAAKLREQAVKQGQRAGEAAREAIDTGKNALDAARVPVTAAVADVQAKANAAFANQGTQTSAEIKEFANNITKTFLGFLGTLPDKIREYLPGIEEGFNKLLKSFGINVEEAPKTFAERLKKDKSGQSTLKAMEIALKDAGFPGVTAKELEKLAQPRDKGGDPEAFQRIVESLDKYYEAQKQLKSGNLPKLLEGVARKQVEDAGSNLQKAIKSADAFKDIADNFKVATTPLAFGEQFEIFKKIFPRIELAQSVFEELPDVSRQFITRIAFDLNKAKEKLDAIQVGTKEGGPNFSAQVSEKARELNKNISDSETVIREYLKNWMTSFDALKPLIEKSGLSIDKLDFTILSDELQDQVKTLLEQAVEAVNIFNRPDISRDARRKAAENFKNAQQSIKNIFEPPKELENVTTFSVFQTGLKEAGVQIEDELLARIRLFDEATTDAILRGIIELQFTKGLPPEEAAIARAAIVKYIQDNIANSFPKRADDLKAKTEEASKAFASSITESITSNLSDILKGKKTLKEGLKGIIDTFTSTVVDTFVRGLMSPLTGEKGLLTTLFSNLGGSIFSFGNDLTKNITTDTLIATSNALLVTANTTLAGILATLTVKTATDTFMPTAAAFLYGLAEGGKVSGPGTSTSDSIPAMLSNGEFVINARAAKNNLDLLSAINSGKIRKFAEGGLVSSALIATPAFADLSSIPTNQTTSNNQVININITGDISRQTKAEIYQMLPTIAEGVNIHNKERGYR